MFVKHNCKTLVRITSCVPSLLILYVFQIIIDIISPIVNACVFNQYCGHWLFSNALHAEITMSLKLKEQFKMTPFMFNLIEDGIAMVLELLNIKKQVCDFLDGFLSFPTKYEKKKTHNMLILMLNPRFESFKLVASFSSWKQIVSMVKDSDKQFLFPILLKCHHVFHSMLKFETMID